MAADGGDWQLVRRGARRKARAPRRRAPADAPAAASPQQPENVSEDKQRAIEQRVSRAAEEIAASPLLRAAADAIAAHFRPADAAAREDEPPLPLDVVAYGLGSFCASSNAMYQLAFLVALVRDLSLHRESGGGRAEVFDPVMNESDARIAERFGLAVLSENECGRRRARTRTVFFMPHCGAALYENVVASNWGERLRDVVIIGNSFAAYSDRTIGAAERRDLLLLRVLPFVTETPLPVGVDKRHDEFSRYEAAFNDLSVLLFSDAAAAEQDAELSSLMARIAAGGDGARDRDELITSR